MDTPRDVILASFGGPEQVEQLEDYLRRLFSDRRIIGAPGPIRRWLAARIARKRASKVAPKYQAMGGGSPLNATTREQARLLEAELNRQGKPARRVHAAFLYADPTIEVTLDALAEQGAPPPVVLPLFPQGGFAGTGSVTDQIGRRPAILLPDFADHPGFAAWHVARIRHALEGADPAASTVLFAAHSMPVSYVRKGDPYVGRVRDSVASVMAALDDLPGLDHRLGFTSRVGPVEWVGPMIEEVAAEVPADRTTWIVVPIVFVGEHLETRHDLDTLFRDRVADLRPDVTIHRTPAPTTEPDWIALLAELVLVG